MSFLDTALSKTNNTITNSRSKPKSNYNSDFRWLELISPSFQRKSSALFQFESRSSIQDFPTKALHLKNRDPYFCLFVSPAQTQNPPKNFTVSLSSLPRSWLHTQRQSDYLHRLHLQLRILRLRSNSSKTTATAAASSGSGSSNNASHGQWQL